MEFADAGVVINGQARIAKPPYSRINSGGNLSSMCRKKEFWGIFNTGESNVPNLIKAKDIPAQGEVSVIRAGQNVYAVFLVSSITSVRLDEFGFLENINVQTAKGSFRFGVNHMSDFAKEDLEGILVVQTDCENCKKDEKGITLSDGFVSVMLGSKELGIQSSWESIPEEADELTLV